MKRFLANFYWYRRFCGGKWYLNQYISPAGYVFYLRWDRQPVQKPTYVPDVRITQTINEEDYTKT